ncbi:MAG: DUF896 domain-containing protein [Clostridia bacterium]|nr:DUF896 domain-containing protein [Clostridia bacterium]
MDHASIERINTLARKSKTVGLTDEEKQEQAALRRQYLDEFRAGMEAQLAGVVLERPDGTKEHLKKRST